MILAAAACGEGKGPPPRELSLAWQSLAWSALPEAGGLRDQRAGELARMNRAASVYEAFRSWRASTNWVEWRDAHLQQWDVVASVLRLRDTRNGKAQSQNHPRSHG